MTLKLYNTLSRSKDEFTPADAGNVKMYVCGPTVYARPHIGNARSVVVYDVLYRLLKHLYPKVTYVRNITDVDDKINAAAIERGISIQALTKEVTQQFHEDMDALGCLRPTVEPRATEHIQEMITIIEALIKNGHAYVSEGHVLFDVSSKLSGVRCQVSAESETRNLKPDTWFYGMLSGRIQDDLKAGARIEVESYKRNAGDFVLWKPTDPKDDASSVFDSPWGKGRPGWHIECSAMSSKYLGNDFDIHGGGADLMFPHHENEIAQSCCAHPGTGYAKVWVHNGFLTVNGEKMSKSLGNFITVRDLLDKSVRGEDIRFALLTAKYNEPLDWNEKLISDAKKTLDKWYRQVAGINAPHPNLPPQGGKGQQSLLSPQGGKGLPISSSPLTGEGGGELPPAFLEALSDDMNLPKAFSLMHAASPEELFAMGKLLGFFGMTSEERAKGAIAKMSTNLLSSGSINADLVVKYSLGSKVSIIGKKSTESKKGTPLFFRWILEIFFKILIILGIKPPKCFRYEERGASLSTNKLDSEEAQIRTLITARIAAKQSKNWKEADRIRDELKAQGIILEDKPDGTTEWRRA